MASSEKGEAMLLRTPDCGYTFSVTRKSHDTVTVLRLWIYDLEKRGKGWGTMLYENWEANLPDFIKHIELVAVSPRAAEFWRKMGFVQDFPFSDEGTCCMSKALR